MSIRTSFLVCALLAAALLPISGSAMAQGPKYAAVSASVQPSVIHLGGAGKMTITVEVSPGFHINSVKPKDPSLIATAFKPDPSAASSFGLKFGAPKYPKDEMVKTSSGTINGYTGKVNIVVPFTVEKTAKAQKAGASGTLSYQGCNATACYPPKQDKIDASFVIR